MTYQEMERTMQFILEQQAQFTVNIQGLTELGQRQETRFARIEASIQRHDDQIGQLTDLLGRLAQVQLAVTDRMAELQAAGKETEERLNAFITFVEKYISSRGGNGKQRTEN